MQQQPRVPFLPSDDAILERCSIWVNYMEDVVEAEDMADFDWTETVIESGRQSKDEDDKDDNNESNDEQNNNCKALIKSDCFEGSSSTDDEIDVEQFLNKTSSINEERHRKMNENGIYKALESFDPKQIKNIVVPFIEKNKLDESNNSTLFDHIVHIEEHHHRYHNSDSDDSVDTANYIKKNRNKRRPSSSTTTIKKISYVKGLRRRKKSKGCNCDSNLNRDLAAVFQRNFPKDLERNQNCGLGETSAKPATTKTNFRSQPATETPSVQQTPKRVRSRNMKRRSDITKCSDKLKRSMSSTSTESHSSSTHRSRLWPKHRNKTEQKKNASEHTNLKEKPKKPTVAADQQKQDETGFLSNNVINSTSVSNTQSIPTKLCNVSPIQNKNSQKSVGIRTEETPRVLLYRPLEQTTSNESEITITTEELQKAVGLKNSRRYLYLFSKEMPYKCSSKTTLYFELPPESAASDLSDDDWIDFAGRTGGFIEEK